LTEDTIWENETIPIAATILPNFFPIYFGQTPVYGDLRKDDTRAQLGSLGQGYELWANAANIALESINDIAIVIQSMSGEGAKGQ